MTVCCLSFYSCEVCLFRDIQLTLSFNLLLCLSMANYFVAEAKRTWSTFIVYLHRGLVIESVCSVSWSESSLEKAIVFNVTNLQAEVFSFQTNAASLGPGGWVAGGVISLEGLPSPSVLTATIKLKKINRIGTDVNDLLTFICYLVSLHLAWVCCLLSLLISHTHPQTHTFTPCSTRWKGLGLPLP